MEAEKEEGFFPQGSTSVRIRDSSLVPLSSALFPFVADRYQTAFLPSLVQCLRRNWIAVGQRCHPNGHINVQVIILCLVFTSWKPGRQFWYFIQFYNLYNFCILTNSIYLKVKRKKASPPLLKKLQPKNRKKHLAQSVFPTLTQISIIPFSLNFELIDFQVRCLLFLTSVTFCLGHTIYLLNTGIAFVSSVLQCSKVIEKYQQ